jgi:D-serine deaminase-like pyridoxal phosphate-dependent protein
MPDLAPTLVDQLDTPSLLVDRDVLDRNIEAMGRQARERGVDLRPHFKTHKSVQIAQLQLQHGATGLTCATLGEARVLADAGVEDIFVAYPVWPGGPKKQLLRQLADQVTLSVGLDSTVSADALAGALGATPGSLRVLVEVDTGGHRTGVRPADAGALAVHAARLGLDVAGVFTHGGHSYGLGDAPQRAARDEVDGLAEAAAALRSNGVEPRVVSAGSTPTAMLSATGPVTEERPGTYVFGDRQQVAIGSCRDADVALTVASTVVSRAVPGQLVLDAGTKCLGRETQPWIEGYAEVVGWPSVRLERLNDHHGVATLHGAGDDAPGVGSVVQLVPNHVCPTVNLAQELVLTRAGEILDRWPVDARALV